MKASARQGLLDCRTEQEGSPEIALQALWGEKSENLLVFFQSRWKKAADTVLSPDLKEA